MRQLMDLLDVTNIYRRHGKRLLDLLGSLGLLVATAPVQLAAGLAIALEDGRPVYFHQQRGGIRGTQFRLHKFRTMRVGTEEKAGSFPTNDMVTKVGGVLRRYSIDEVPQLLNILQGSMSFVGPRPPLVSHLGRYTERQRRRLEVRPGLTGLAQVKFRNNAPWSRRIEADLEYIENLSFRGDLAIVLSTVAAVLLGRNQVVGQTEAEVDDLVRPADPTVDPIGGHLNEPRLIGKSWSEELL